MTISNFIILLLYPDRTFTSSLNWLPCWLHCVVLIGHFRRLGSQMDRFQSSLLIKSNILHMRAQPEQESVRNPSSKQTRLSQQNPRHHQGKCVSPFKSTIIKYTVTQQCGTEIEQSASLQSTEGWPEAARQQIKTQANFYSLQEKNIHLYRCYFGKSVFLLACWNNCRVRPVVFSDSWRENASTKGTIWYQKDADSEILRPCMSVVLKHEVICLFHMR